MPAHRHFYRETSARGGKAAGERLPASACRSLAPPSGRRWHWAVMKVQILVCTNGISRTGKQYLGCLRSSQKIANLPTQHQISVLFLKHRC